MKLIFVLIIFVNLPCYAAAKGKTVTGTYSDGVTKLTLYPDNTFKLSQCDPIFTYTYDHYENTGNWVADGYTVTLNPGKFKRSTVVSHIEKNIPGEDSITFKINYFIEVFSNNEFIKKKALNFDMLSIYINKRRNYYHLVHRKHISTCGFAPVIKRQHILDSTNVFKVAKQELNNVSMFSYGFDNPVFLNIKNKKSNFFEITIVHPVDREREPQNKKVIIKRDGVFFYEHRGKVSTSIWASMLMRERKKRH